MAVVVTTPAPALAAPKLRQPRARLRPEWLAGLAAITLALLLVEGGLARVLPQDGWLDWATRAVGAASWAVLLAAAAAVWALRRGVIGVLLAATLAPVALLAQTTLDVLLDDAAAAEVSHLAWGLVTIGLLVWTAMVAGRVDQRSLTRSAELRFFSRVAQVTTGLLLVSLVSGALVRAAGASWACAGFPDCNDLGVLPLGREPLMDLNLYHRLFSMTAAALVVWLTVEAQRHRRSWDPALVQATLLLGGLTLLEAVVGVTSVISGVPAQAELLHLSLGVGLWVSAIRVLALAGQAPVQLLVAREHSSSTLVAYVQLTKPRVMSLLLVTTAAAMVVAARGMPPIDLLLATLVGGALMSGGAGAINHYVDRDIDPLMGRTAWRPIPSGRVSPTRALLFGLTLSGVATLILVLLVNRLAAGLALAGLVGYVGVYSLWLKRSTPSNIVIGGAAGAIPPLVGWAAVNGDLGLTAWYLFAIVFFWTPPHFWALALLIQQHYANAHVPMLPVVRGEAETRRQILLYALLLVALTLVLAPLGLMGTLYFGAAALLGGWFVWNAVRLWREATRAAARRLYVYSILYLFALFAAMAVDRAV